MQKGKQQYIQRRRDHVWMTTVARSDNARDREGGKNTLAVLSLTVNLITIFKILLIISQLQRGPPGAIHFALYSYDTYSKSVSQSQGRSPEDEDISNSRWSSLEGAHRTLGVTSGASYLESRRAENVVPTFCSSRQKCTSQQHRGNRRTSTRRY